MYDLSRFKKAQERDYPSALAEIRSGRKRSHWIWYVFPQLKALGHSGNAKYYGMEDLAEARAYMADPLLRRRLIEISEALLALDLSDPLAVMGSPDDLKLRSCMTLFREAAPEETVFSAVLEKYFGGMPDERTLALLKENASAGPH
ncbi:MAG: DUF1810 domain-containing protein [Mailhella sp.]|nr:DUF1810 domain-containing protein [Mailhella sp.]